jgi:hypothetical protein
MPTAESFNALGVGNGFPRCLNKVDVSVYDRWITSSGVNKDSPTASDADIALSLEISMSLFWNLNKVNGDASATYDTDTVSVTDATIAIFNFTPDSSSAGPRPPVERLCNTNLSAQEIIYIPNGPQSRQARFKVTLNVPFRMYDGSTSDESNFVGYGFGGSIAQASGSSIVTAVVEIRSYGDESILATHDYAYVSIGDANFTCETIGGDTSDASALTASSSGSGFGLTWSSSAEITSLDFYTY